MINNVVLVGRITHDLELKETNSGKKWVRFSVALNRAEEVDYVTVVAWEQQAENLVKYQSKGSLIGVEGRIKTSTFDRQDGTKGYNFDIVAHSITYLESKKDSEKTPAATENKDNVPF